MHGWPWWHMSDIQVHGGSKNKGITQARLGKNKRHYLKNNQNKKDGGMAQVVKCFPSKQVALSSTPSTTRKREKNVPN